MLYRYWPLYETSKRKKSCKLSANYKAFREMKYFFTFFALYIFSICSIRAEEPNVHTASQKEHIDFFSEEELKTNNEETAPLPSMESLLLKTVFMLITMILALVALLWIVKRIQGGGKLISSSKNAKERHIELIEKSYLSSKTIIWYARIDGHPYTIVEGQHGVALTEVRKPFTTVDLTNIEGVK